QRRFGGSASSPPWSAPRGAKDATGKRPGVLAMVHHPLTADDDMVDALPALAAAGGPIRAVPADPLLLAPPAGGIQDHEAGHHALAHEAAVAQAHDAGRLEGEAPDGVFEGQELALADPLAQHVARLARGAEVRVEVGAGIGLRRNRVARLHVLGQLDVFIA